MLGIRGLFTWFIRYTSKWLRSDHILAPFFAVLDVCGCLFKFCIWVVIFSIGSALQLLGLFFLIIISILGQITSMFERRPQEPTKKRRLQANTKRPKSSDMSSSRTSKRGTTMDYDTVISTARGLYKCRRRPKFSCPDYWAPGRYSGNDSAYFTDSPATPSVRSFDGSWISGRP